MASRPPLAVTLQAASSREVLRPERQVVDSAANSSLNKLGHDMQSNLLLGALKITEPARLVLKRQPYDLLARLAVNEHGLITDA